MPGGLACVVIFLAGASLLLVNLACLNSCERGAFQGDMKIGELAKVSRISVPYCVILSASMNQTSMSFPPDWV